ncbi:MAG: hypothetical protein HQL46_05295 [Gammaproteobacteria bacterium]|nr:hypothetical protein [Gammaproteobacteria bacterium]
MSNKLLKKSHVFATSVAASSMVMIAAQNVSAEQLFSTTKLANGYQVAMSHGSCGGKIKAEGTCGGKTKTEGTCGGKTTKEGTCGGNKSEESKTKQEGKCGEAKCGSNK